MNGIVIMNEMMGMSRIKVKMWVLLKLCEAPMVSEHAGVEDIDRYTPTQPGDNVERVINDGCRGALAS